MPGKKDPEYFPVNLNAGIGGFYGPGIPLNGQPHGKFEYDNSALNMSFNVSIPPVNSEDETDDESSSVTGSDIDVDVDTLVMSIREKLKMSPKFNTKPTNFWTESPPSSDNSQCVVGGNNNNNNGSTRRCRNHPYSHSQWRHNVHHTSNHHPNYQRQIINGGIQKQHKSNCHHWWTSKSFNDISKTKKSSGSSPTPHPYTLLQELIDSGSLIKEAVRRINLKQKRLTSINPNSNGSLTKKIYLQR